MTKSFNNDMKNIKRFMIAAAGSGSGKTTITCGLIAYFKKQGRAVKAYKCGPDYIDPMFHKKVLGISSENLDAYFMNESELRYTVSASPYDVSIIEGVMGIYDGLSSESDFASSYDIARKTNTPIVLVIDSHGMGRTILSVLKGLLLDDEDNLIRGIVFNRMSNPFFDQIKQMVNDLLAEIHPETYVIGCIPKMVDIKLDSRHLGLVLPEEIEDLNTRIERVLDMLEKQLDMEKLEKVMLTKMQGNETQKNDNEVMSTTRKDITQTSLNDEVMSTTSPPQSTSIRVAVARDEAFCFYYDANLSLLEAYGCELVFFSPIHDKELPEDIHALVIGGGYPELFLDKLSKNETMLQSIKAAIMNGIPNLAECGGFMYLHESIVDENGNSFSMVGATKGSCYKKDKLVRFGYMYVEASNNIIELNRNTNDKKNNENTFDTLSELLVGMKGHEFHYYDSTDNGNAVVLSKPNKSKTWQGLHIGENFVWGFPHFYYNSNTRFVEAFIDRCVKYKNQN